MDINFAAAVLQNIKEPIPFIGPKSSTDLWKKMGAYLLTDVLLLRPGDVVKIKDVET